jgi:CBS domain-containing protein
MTTARDVMSTRLVTVSPEASVYEAMHLLIDRDITGVPVVGADGKVLGIVTEKDLLETVYQDDPGGMGRVIDIMTSDLISFDEDSDLSEIAEAMIEGHFRRVPIFSGDQLSGIVTRRDIIRHHLEVRRAEATAAQEG